MTTKAAIIGAGQIAKQHLGCLRELPDVTIAGVCDLSPAMARATANRFGVSQWYTDYRKLLDEQHPDMVHITTPPATHFAIAGDCLRAGCHVLVEKPITVKYEEAEALLELGRQGQRMVLEDHNYLHNASVRQLRGLVASGEFGEVVHVEVIFCLDILAPGSRYVDPNSPHPCLTLPGGVIGDFLPHMAYLAHAFIGPHARVATVWQKRDLTSPLSSDEFRALIRADRGTAALVFSAHSQPDAFLLRVYGTRMCASTNLFDTGLVIRRVRPGAKPLASLANGLAESRAMRSSAWGSLRRKLRGGPGSYEGLWWLLARTYEALASGGQPPVSPRQIMEVSRLVSDLVDPRSCL